MRVIILAFLACLSLIACQQSPFDHAPPTNSPNVKLSDDGGHGSGTHLGNGYVISAAHVVEGKTSMKVRFADGQVTTATVLWASKESDVALLRYDDRGQASAANLACRDPIDGEAVHAIGNPTQHENLTMRGFVAGAPLKLGPWQSVSPTDLTILPGMSGGGVFDAHGQLIGVSVGTMVWPLSMFAVTWGRVGYIVPGLSVCRLLARVA